MNPILYALLLSAGTFTGIVACMRLAFWWYGRNPEAHPGDKAEGINAIDASIYALLGLLLAFAFGSAVSRFDARRGLIIEETNAIGTAYMRLDVLPAAEQPAVRALFRDYVNARMQFIVQQPGSAEAARAAAQVTALQNAIWRRAIDAIPTYDQQETIALLLESLNEMFDAATARTVAAGSHMPLFIISLLVAVALLSGVVAGLSMARKHYRSNFHMYMYAGAIAITLYAIIDLDSPRNGLIRVDAADRALVQLQQSITESIPPAPATTPLPRSE